MMTCTFCDSAAASAHSVPPAALKALRAGALGSKPHTVKPAFIRLPAIAEPMMPRPSKPTVCSGTAAGLAAVRATGSAF